jgi:hypothetical protein
VLHQYNFAETKTIKSLGELGGGEGITEGSKVLQREIGSGVEVNVGDGVSVSVKVGVVVNVGDGVLVNVDVKDNAISVNFASAVWAAYIGIMLL